VRIGLGTIRWKEWWVMHCKLSAAQLESLQPGSTLEALEITGGRNAEDRVLYFDNLAFYKEELPPLSFLPRPKRGVTQLAGQDQGLNTRPGILPFPTR
jgi:hypothetical protein